MASSNPVLTNLPDADAQYSQVAYPAEVREDRPMTVDDVVAKTGITLAVIVAFAALNFFIYGSGNAGLGTILTFGGAIAAFITVLVHSFGRQFGNPVVTLLLSLIHI